MKNNLKLLFKVLIALGCLALLFSCAKNGAYKGIARGIYDGANQVREMKKDDPAPETNNEVPSYDQYERERQEALKKDGSK